MKKIYALAAVAMMGLAANAQNGAPLYICGDGSGLAWDPAAPAEFTYANGAYTFESETLASFKISTAMGDWDTFNASALGCGENGYGEEQGVAVALVAWGDNINCPWPGNYTITVAGDLSTITLSTETPKPTGATRIYFRGEMNGWGAPEEWEFHLSDENNTNVYEFTCGDDQMITAGESFKIAADPWAVLNMGNAIGSAYMLDTELDLDKVSADPANMQLEEDFNGVCFVQIEPAMVFFSNDKESENPFLPTGAVENISIENNEAVKYFNLQGVQVANPESGLVIVVKGGKATKVLVK